MVEKRSARSERTQTITQARAVVATGPDDVFAKHTTTAFIAELSVTRPHHGEVVGCKTPIAQREVPRGAEFIGGTRSVPGELRWR